MRVVCKKNQYYLGSSIVVDHDLTVGKSYNVIEELEYEYIIGNDRGHISNEKKWIFYSISELRDNKIDSILNDITTK